MGPNIKLNKNYTHKKILNITLLHQENQEQTNWRK